MELKQMGLWMGRALAPALLGSALLAACGGGSTGASTEAQIASDDGGTADSAARAKRLSGDSGTETALTPVSATASSMERGDLSGAKAIDKDDNSRWGSAFTDNEWLTLDYGSSVSISRVRISWDRCLHWQMGLYIRAFGHQ